MRKEFESREEFFKALDEPKRFDGKTIDPKKLEKAESLRKIAEELASTSKFYSCLTIDKNDRDFFIARVFASDLFPNAENAEKSIKLLADGANIADEWFITCSDDENENDSTHGIVITFIVRDYWLE